MQQGERHLPKRYADDRLQVLALDPNRLWVYWDEGVAIRRIAAKYLAAGWEQAPRQLRIRGSDGEERMVECDADFGSHYVEGLRAGAEYRVEYGIQQQERFLPLLESNVHVPGPGALILPRQELTESISSYTFYSLV